MQIEEGRMSDWKDKLKNSEFNKGGGMKKKCLECKEEFVPKEPHHKICSVCNKKRYDGGDSSDKTRLKLPDNYLSQGYYDENGQLRADIFKDEARVAANVLASWNTTPTSLRVFYNKLKAIENRYKYSGKDFNLIKPGLYAFERDVAYQISRSVVSEEFRKFININSEIALRGPKEFKGFIEHFLSVLSFFKDVSKK
jgi:CRISPR type III-A-associated protein Csm2